MIFPCVVACLCVSLSSVQSPLQWPQQLGDPDWMPRIGYLRQASALVGRKVVSPKLTFKAGDGTVKWSLVNAPPGVEINDNNQIEWDSPTQGRYLIVVNADSHGSTEQTSWSLNVLKPLCDDPVLYSTRHMDYVVPGSYAQWMDKVKAAKVIDAYYEYGRDLVGLPCDARQSLLCDPAVGGAHNGIPIVCGLQPLGGNDQEHWRLGFLFHELGHNLNPYIRVDYLEGGDHQLDIWLHGMVEFDKISWVVKMLAAPDKQGTPDVDNFAAWMKTESMEFVSNYQDYMKHLPNAQFATWTSSPSAVWAGLVHEFAFTYGSEAVQKVLRCMRRDGLPLDQYPPNSNSIDRLTILECVMSCATGQDLLPKFQAMNFPVNEAEYDRLYAHVVHVMKNLPAIGVNGAVKCPVDGHYYCLTPHAMSWPEAEATARRLGGHLATIRSPDQEAWLSNLYGRNGWMWVGAWRDNATNRWSWIDGETPPDPVWEPERPETDPNKIYAVLILHQDGNKNDKGWFGMANRPHDENEIGIMEFTHVPTTDTDSLN